MNIYSKTHSLLTALERRNTLILLALMIVGMLLETMGIGLIIPVVSLMMQGDLVASYPQIQPLIQLLGEPSQKELVVMAMFALVGVYLIKNTFIAFLVWKQANFVFDVQANLSQRLFANYLRQPYTFHLQRNSAQLVRNVTGEVNIFSGGVTSALLFISEIFVVVGITILLLLVEPLGASLVVLVLGGAAWGFHRITRQRIARWGEARQIHDGLRLQHIQQGLAGVKDVKLLGREADFLLQFNTHNTNSARMWKFQTTLQNLPRLMFEMLAITGLVILVLTMINQGREITSLVPTLGLFAAAAFRLMPSVNRILASAQVLQYSFPVVNTLYEELKQKSSKQNPKNKNKNKNGRIKSEILLNNVTYSYENTEEAAIQSISIEIRQGEFVGFIGSSGSGKSTLVDVILGLLTPNIGKILVDGNDIQLDLRQWQDQLGYVPQSIYLTDDTLRRNVAFGMPDGQIDDLAVKRAIEAAQLKEFVDTLAEGLETFVGERGIRLSGGQRQRIGIARALYHDPTVLVLDEATSALDGATEREVMESVSRLQGTKTIIVVAHRLSTVENCDRLYRLDRGHIVDVGSPKDIIAKQKNISGLKK